jgi:uncharacterized cupin superfamily protein
LYELPPESSSFPLHVHHANEETLIVLAGRPILRTLDGKREVQMVNEAFRPEAGDGVAAQAARGVDAVREDG